MTSRAPGWRGSGADEISTTIMSPVTPALIDEAVDYVQARTTTDAGTAEALRTTMMNDVNSDAAQALFNAEAAMSRAALVTVGRKELTIPYPLDDGDVRALTEYASEFKLRFTNVKSHDHPMAAACRIIDSAVLFSRVPKGVKFSDIGGNPLTYINRSFPNWHVCGDQLDRKDAQRYALRKLEAERLTESANAEVRRLAGRYLAHDPEYVCGKRAQECHVQTPIGLVIHVYDIPIADWPSIMAKKNLEIVEGALLFSKQFFREKSGVLGVSKSRYEIDTDNDTFRMGFSGSPAWWYEHSWSKYMLYGTDQVMYYGGRMYSYKIIERRGDTVFFRILRSAVAPHLTRVNTWFRYPEVPIVVVNGFDMSSGQSNGGLVKRTHRFPKSIWVDLVNQAAEDYERGTLDFVRMFNHYRTLSVRQTINSVLVMGDNKVAESEQVALVVHACLAAAAMSLLGQRTTRELTSDVMSRRVLASESLVAKIADLTVTFFTVAVRSFAGLLIFPLRYLRSVVEYRHGQMVTEYLVKWAPEWEYEMVPARPMFGTGKSAGSTLDAMNEPIGPPRFPVDHHEDDYAGLMSTPELAKKLFNLCPDAVPEGFNVRVEVDEERDSGSIPSTAPPTYATTPGDDRAVLRRAAINEHVDEIRLQVRASEDSCSRAYKQLSVTNGSPNVAALRKRSELYRNPDMWLVSAGVIMSSALGLGPEQFDYGAIYYPEEDADTGSCLRAVFNRDWVDPKNGKTHVNHVVGDSNFNGWVLVTDDLKIYNGPEIQSSMMAALDCEHDYDVTVVEGVPGCGKSYEIAHRCSADRSAMIVCPVKKSISDMRDDFSRMHPEFAKYARRYIRTIDSLLTNWNQEVKNGGLKIDTLYVDECYMTHSGKIFSVAALTGATRVISYGDRKQIPHTPRVQAASHYVRLPGESVEHRWVDRRNPASAVAGWAHVYSNKVRASSTVTGSFTEVKTMEGSEMPKDLTILTMYQADKLEVDRKYSRYKKGYDLMTVHESEGKTLGNVWVMKFDTRVRTDNRSLFDREEYCLVAASRHTHDFVFVNPGSRASGGKLSEWIERARDPRRVAAVLEVGTAGDEF